MRIVAGVFLFHKFTKILIAMAAAQDLTASVLNRIQRKMTEVFTAGATPILDADPNLNKAATVGALLENTNARMNPITQGRTCVGMDVYHIDGAFAADPTVLTTFEGADCDLTPDNYPETIETSYDHNWYEQETIAVSDKDCDNLFNNPAAEGSDRVAELVAHQLGLALISLRSKMNTAAISFLAAGATGVNRDLNLPTYITFNGATDEFEVDSSGFFQRPESLTDLDAVRLNNDMPSYFIVSGRKNFYNNVVDSTFLQRNDNQRSLARWDTQMNTGMIYFDINRLDSTLTGANTFMIYPGSYAMWNVGLYTPNPTVVDPSTNLYAYSITDPSGLVIRENGVLRPVVYNIHYQYVCKGTDVLGRNIFEHVWQIRFLGGKAMAPAATDTHTAILHFTDQFGVGI